MKKQILVLISTLVFTLLFYNESVGLNLSIFGFVLIGLILFQFPLAIKQLNFKIALVSCVLILLSNAWLFGPEMFILTFISLALVRIYAQYSNFALFLAPIIVVIQGLATFVRVFQKPLPILTTSKSQLLRNSVAYIVIPFVFIFGFGFIYIVNSNTLSKFFTAINFSIDGVFFLILFLGFYLMFSFWDGWIYSNIQTFSNSFKNNLSKKIFQKNNSFLTEEQELKSGQITLFLLNIFLIIFIGIYIYEQFFQTTNILTLSQDTHQRVYSLITSIIMAIVVILFFFKDRLNFTENKNSLVKLAYTWIGLNSVLIAITAIKTIDYISFFGLTQQRLGVLWFLILCTFGLWFTYLKVSKIKTNFYLVNKMSWALYIGLVVLVVPNWSACITTYNLTNKKYDESYLRFSLRYNEKQLIEYYKNQPQSDIYSSAYYKIENKQSFNFLSKELYYETINLANYPKPMSEVILTEAVAN